MAQLRTLAAVLLALLVSSAALATTEVRDAPSGKYKDLSTNQLWDFDNTTGLLSATGAYDLALCVGSAETRVMVAGVCADIDTASGPGYDAKGQVLLVGEWSVSARILVNGAQAPHCVPVCFIDAIQGLTYYSFAVTNNDVCKNFPPGAPVTASVTIAVTSGDHSFEGGDQTSFTCPSGGGGGGGGGSVK